jgi:hypothetical protein
MIRQLENKYSNKGQKIKQKKERVDEIWACHGIREKAKKNPGWG